MKLWERTQLSINMVPFDWRLTCWRLTDHDFRVHVGPIFLILAWPYSDAAYKRALK